MVERIRPTVILVTYDVDESLLLADRDSGAQGRKDEDHALDLAPSGGDRITRFHAASIDLLRSQWVPNFPGKKPRHDTTTTPEPVSDDTRLPTKVPGVTPSQSQKALTDLELYVDAARIAEAASSMPCFWPDALVGPDNGQMVSSGQLEPLLLLAALAQHTERRLIGTASTTYSLPYTLARGSSPRWTISKRAGQAWNIVTSWLPPGRRELRAAAERGACRALPHRRRAPVAAVDAPWRSFPGRGRVGRCRIGPVPDYRPGAALSTPCGNAYPYARTAEMCRAGPRAVRCWCRPGSPV